MTGTVYAIKKSSPNERHLLVESNEYEKSLTSAVRSDSSFNPNEMYSSRLTSWTNTFNKTANFLGLPEYIVSDKDMFLIFKFAADTNTPTQLLDILSMHPNLHIRGYVGANKSASEKTLRHLSTDKILDVAVEVASNTSSPQSLLNDMAQPGNHIKIQRAVALNANSSVDTLFLLFSNPDAEIKYNIASNTSTPPWFLRMMADYINGIKLNCNDPQSMDMLRIKMRIAGNINSPEDILLMYASEREHISVISEVVHNTSATENILKRLSESRYEYVRHDVAANQNVTKSILMKLAHDRSDMVKSAVTMNRKADLEILLHIKSDNVELRGL